MRVFARTAVIVLTLLAVAGAQAPAPSSQTTPAPGAQTPAATVPASQTPAPAASTARIFSAPVGMLFVSVRLDRVKEFELFIGWVNAAFQKTTDPVLREQIKGWRILKAAEPVLNNTVTYAFLIDPTVKEADYGFGRIIADAYGEKAAEIWKLYQSSVVGGGSLMNLTPVVLPDPTAPGRAPGPAPGAATQKPAAPNADPSRK